MAKIFKPSEVVQMGIEKEKIRRDFYAQVAKSFGQNQEMSELFVRLRDWEDTHVRRFSQIRDEMAKDEPVESYRGEVESYMKSLVNDKLYNEVSGESFSVKVSTPETALDYAIQFEKDAILFFSELLTYIDSSQIQAITKLIAEEEQHLKYLTVLKNKIG